MFRLPLLVNAKPVFESLCKLHLSILPLPTREALTNQLSVFKAGCKKSHIIDTTIDKAHYFLCASIDEAYYAAASNHGLVAASLLSQFHYDSCGGESFFTKLDQCLDYSEGQIDILALCLHCLNLGFKGKYGVIDGGTQQLLQRRKQLLAIIRRSKIAQSWKNKNQVKSKKCQSNKKRLLYLSLAAFLVSSLCYLSFNHMLGNRMNIFQAHIKQIIRG